MKLQYTIYFFALLILSCKNHSSKRATSNIKVIKSKKSFDYREYTVTSSSDLTEKLNNKFPASNAFDNDITTAWSEDNGKNKWIEITFLKTQLIKEMTIHNGYQKSKETYEENNRMDSFSLYINGKKTLIHSTNHQIEKSKTLQLNQFVKKLKIQVNNVKKGTRYNKLYISDIQFSFTDSKFKNFVSDTIISTKINKKIAFQFKETPNRGYVLDKNMLFKDVLLTSNKEQAISLFKDHNYDDFHAEEVTTPNSSFPFHVVRVYLQSELDFDTYLHFIPKYNMVKKINIFHESALNNDGDFSYKKMSFVDFNKDSYDDIYFTEGNCTYTDCKKFKNEVTGISRKLSNHTFTINFKQ